MGPFLPTMYSAKYLMVCFLVVDEGGPPIVRGGAGGFVAVVLRMISVPRSVRAPVTGVWGQVPAADRRDHGPSSHRVSRLRCTRGAL